MYLTARRATRALAAKVNPCAWTTCGVCRHFSVFERLDSAVQRRSAPGTNGLQLFFLAKEQADSDLWYSKANIPPSFHGRHGVLMLHVWMLNTRLLQLPESAERNETQEVLWDTLWTDTCARIRAEGVAEISVNARLKDVQSWSLPTCLELDYALALLSPKDDTKIDSSRLLSDKPVTELSSVERMDLVADHIAGTLWRQIYQRDELPNSLSPENGSDVSAARDRPQTQEQVVAGLANYILLEQLSLSEQISDGDFSQGLFRFGQVPQEFDGDYSMLKRTRQVPNSRDVEAVAGGGARKPRGSKSSDTRWREAMHVDGKIYYWNPDTLESRWEKPNELQECQEA